MGVVMGIMAVLMVAGFLGFGHHHGMMGGHGDEGHNEITVEDKQIKNEPCTDCPDSGQVLKNGPNQQEGRNQDDKVH